MARKTIELLLLENVENLGIVGDVVKVKAGYARNYLLPHGMAEAPTTAKIDALKEARAKAQAEVDCIRKDRVALVERLEDVHLTLIRAANDQGVLYGSVTQRDISDALNDAGFGVEAAAVRLPAAIRRVGEHHIVIQYEKELKVEVELVINADQPPAEMLEDEQTKDAAPASAPAAAEPAAAG